jgi:hypothetical protein
MVECLNKFFSKGTNVSIFAFVMLSLFIIPDMSQAARPVLKEKVYVLKEHEKVYFSAWPDGFESMYIGGEVKHKAMAIPLKNLYIVKKQFSVFSGISSKSLSCGNTDIEFGIQLFHKKERGQHLGKNSLMFGDYYACLIKAYPLNHYFDVLIGAGLTHLSKDMVVVKNNKFIPRAIGGMTVQLNSRCRLRASLVWDNTRKIRTDFMGNRSDDIKDCFSPSIGIFYDFSL